MSFDENITVKLSQDKIRIIPYELAIESLFFKSFIDFETINKTYRLEIDLTDWDDYIFDAILEHMNQPKPRMSLNLRHYSNFIIRSIEKMSDYLLYEPLQVIQMSITYSQRRGKEYLESTHPFVTHRFKSEINANEVFFPSKSQRYPSDASQRYPSDASQRYPSDASQRYPSDASQRYPIYLKIVREMVRQFKMSVAKILIEIYEGNRWFLHVIFINDGMESMPTIPFSMLQRGHSKKALIQIEDYSGFYSHSYHSILSSREII